MRVESLTLWRARRSLRTGFGRPDCCFQCNDARVQNEISAILSLRVKEKRPEWKEKELQALYEQLSKGIRERVKEDGPVVTPADKFIARPAGFDEAAASKRKLAACKSKGCKNKTAAAEGLCKDHKSKAIKAAASAASAEAASAERSGDEAVDAPAAAADKDEEED